MTTRVVVRAFTALCVAVFAMRAAADSVPPLPSLLGFEAGRSFLAEVQARLGQASEIQEPKNPEGFPGLCYRSSAADDRTFVIFRAGPSFSFPGDISEFTIRAGPPEDVRANSCTRTRPVRGSLHLSNGLSLGMREKDALKLLGAPAQRSTGKLVYSTQYRRDITPDDMAKLVEVMGADLATGNRVLLGNAVVEIALRKGRVASITVTRVEEPSKR